MNSSRMSIRVALNIPRCCQLGQIPIVAFQYLSTLCPTRSVNSVEHQHCCRPFIPYLVLPNVLCAWALCQIFSPPSINTMFTWKSTAFQLELNRVLNRRSRLTEFLTKKQFENQIRSTLLFRNALSSLPFSKP